MALGGMALGGMGTGTGGGAALLDDFSLLAGGGGGIGGGGGNGGLMAGGSGGGGDADFAEFRRITCAQLAAVSLGAPGRFFAIVSLAEAEALRGALHIAQTAPGGLGLGGTKLALLAHGSPLDLSPGCEPAFDYQVRMFSRFPSF